MPQIINSSLTIAAKRALVRSVKPSLRAPIATLLTTRSYWAGQPHGGNIPDPKGFPRQPQPDTIHAPPINHADTLQSRSDQLHTYGKYLISCLPKHIQQFSVWKDELTLHIAPSSVLPVFNFLSLHTASQFHQISDICGVDYPTRPNRFEIVYNCLSHRFNSRIRVKTYADEASPVPSISELFDGVMWYEREAYDLFGIFFTGHPDLRRLLTDYGFDGHPLRKDFPLTGYTEVRYDEEKKRVVMEPLELTQAFRNFQGGSSVWEQVGEGRDLRPEEFKLPKPEPEEKKEEKK